MLDLQGAYDRIVVAAEVGNRVARLLEEEDIVSEDSKGTADRTHESALRCVLLELSTRMIFNVCSEEMSLDVKRRGQPVDTKDLPSSLPAASDVVARFLADAEQAFDVLTLRLALVITQDDGLFLNCIANSLEYLDPTDPDCWKFVSNVVRQYRSYRNTFVEAVIEPEAAVLSMLEEFGSGSDKLSQTLKIESWTQVALAHLYTKAERVRHEQSSDVPYSSTDENAKLVGQAAVQIWRSDDNYRDTRSWFPPSHPWWPLHLPGHPQVLREWSLPYGSVANVVFLPWGTLTVAVGMSSGALLIFCTTSNQAIRTFSTGILPASVA